MNKRSFLKSALAAFALTSGLARASLEVVSVPEPAEWVEHGVDIWNEWNPKTERYERITAQFFNGKYTSVQRSA